ncbi:hypothetical protein LCGC14_0741670 [marine sediment metagenome]|uniref:Uncharacterized protein n=1 Tax=marine sediment metagenome TaxID=412755 RepID=A0A0F9TDK7_9ZZZZ
MSEKEWKDCLDDAEKKALYWLWLKKTGKEKVIEAFDDLRKTAEKCDLIKKKKG